MAHEMDGRSETPAAMPPGPPRVSVIMIFLNAERFIDEAIQSVLSQTFESYELLLVDDGSTAACTGIAQSYARRFPRKVFYLEHEGHRNRGMSATRNLGLSAARGEFVAFIDADDVWQPSKLQEQVAIMDAHSDIGMVCGAVRYWNSWRDREDVIIPTGHVANAVVPPPEASLQLYPLGSAPAPCPSDLLLRRDVVTKVGGFEEHFTGPYQMYEDQAFLGKLYLASPVYFSDRIWLNYRQHETSCVSAVSREGLYDQVRAYFLSWFEQYIHAIPHVDPRVVSAVHRAIFHQHPIVRAARQPYRFLRDGFRRLKSSL